MIWLYRVTIFELRNLFKFQRAKRPIMIAAITYIVIIIDFLINVVPHPKDK